MSNWLYDIELRLMFWATKRRWVPTWVKAVLSRWSALLYLRLKPEETQK